MSRRWIFVDNCTLLNFARIKRLDLVQSTLRGRGRWTAAVEWEVKQSAGYVPELRRVLDDSWLGEPITFTSDADTRAVATLQRVLSRPNDKATKNLGDAECIHAILSRPEFRESTFLTDDGPAADLARVRGVSVNLSMHLLSEAYSSGDIGCPDAFNLLGDMIDAGGSPYMPDNHRDVCP